MLQVWFSYETNPALTINSKVFTSNSALITVHEFQRNKAVHYGNMIYGCRAAPCAILKKTSNMAVATLSELQK